MNSAAPVGYALAMSVGTYLQTCVGAEGRHRLLSLRTEPRCCVRTCTGSHNGSKAELDICDKCSCCTARPPFAFHTRRAAHVTRVERLELAVNHDLYRYSVVF